MFAMGLIAGIFGIIAAVILAPGEYVVKPEGKQL